MAARGRALLHTGLAGAPMIALASVPGPPAGRPVPIPAPNPAAAPAAAPAADAPPATTDAPLAGTAGHAAPAATSGEAPAAAPAPATCPNLPPLSRRTGSRYDTRVQRSRPKPARRRQPRLPIKPGMLPEARPADASLVLRSGGGTGEPRPPRQPPRRFPLARHR